MRDFDDPRLFDAHIAALAGRQHGVVAAWQLADLGIGADAIAPAPRAPELHRVRRGVDAAGHPALSADGRLMAAVLACGPGTVLSHQSAADVWGLRPSSSPRFHVSIPSRSTRRLEGIVVHHPRALPDTEITTRRGMPITTVARTLLDLADVVDARSLARAVKRAETGRLFDLRAVETTIERHPGRATRKLRHAVDAWDGAATRSALEDRFLELCRGYGLPRPETNVLVAGREVDVLWREQLLAVELDSWRYHGTRAHFELDRARDAELLARGIRTVRITDRRLDEEPDKVFGALAHLLTL